MARRSRSRGRRSSGRRSSRRRSGGYRPKSKFMKWLMWIVIAAVLGIVAVAVFAKNPPKWIPKFLLKIRKDNGLIADQGGNKPSDQVKEPVATLTTKI